MLTDPGRQQQIIEALRSLESTSYDQTGLMTPQTAQQSRKMKAATVSPVPAPNLN